MLYVDPILTPLSFRRWSNQTIPRIKCEYLPICVHRSIHMQSLEPGYSISNKPERRLMHPMLPSSSKCVPQGSFLISLISVSTSSFSSLLGPPVASSTALTSFLSSGIALSISFARVSLKLENAASLPIIN